MSRPRYTLVVVAAAAAIACRSPSESASRKTQPVPTAIGGGHPAGPEDDVMFVEHFARTLRMREAVIHGDLERARRESRALAARDMPANFPERWKPFIDELRAAALIGADVETLARAGDAVARIATTCGDCHRALGGPTFTVGEPPPLAPTVKASMARHAWSADRLWMGLVQPSDDAWSKGSVALTDAPLLAPEPRPAQQDLARRVHALGERAQTLTGLAKAPQRTALVGELLATGAGCHSATSGQP